MAIVEYPQSTKCTSPVTAPERSDSRYRAEPPTSVRVGVRFSGEYFITDTTHTISDAGYITKFNGRREEPGK